MDFQAMLADIYLKYGFSREVGISVVRPGKSGAEEIQAIMKNFRENPPKTLAGSPVRTAHAGWKSSRTMALSTSSMWQKARLKSLTSPPHPMCSSTSQPTAQRYQFAPQALSPRSSSTSRSRFPWPRLRTTMPAVKPLKRKSKLSRKISVSTD